MSVEAESLSYGCLPSDVLASILSNCVPPVRVAAIRERRSNPLTSYFDSEIVTCELRDGRAITLLCKGERANTRQSWGHRGGVVYEAKVYDYILSVIGVSTPRYYGTHRDAKTGTKWIVMEYLKDAEYSGAPQLPKIADWLGAFHRNGVSFAVNDAAAFLIRYDLDYFRGWAHRTREFVGAAGGTWLAALCNRFAKAASSLLAEPTIIHGECYQMNILSRGSNVHPIDWESCAIGPGEIDLAMLTEEWPLDVVCETEERYQRARWSGSPPDGFVERLALARVYLQLRWLGDNAKRTSRERGRVDDLRDAGERAGLL